jgi:hypothetical protein
MLPGLYEVVIQENFPLFVKKFAVTVGHECRAWRFTPSRLCTSEVLEAGRELSRVISGWHKRNYAVSRLTVWK